MHMQRASDGRFNAADRLGVSLDVHIRELVYRRQEYRREEMRCCRKRLSIRECNTTILNADCKKTGYKTGTHQSGIICVFGDEGVCAVHVSYPGWIGGRSVGSTGTDRLADVQGKSLNFSVSSVRGRDYCPDLARCIEHVNSSTCAKPSCLPFPAICLPLARPEGRPVVKGSA
jgi:hypothetical protein